jgi:hypothetical protein
MTESKEKCSKTVSREREKRERERERAKEEIICHFYMISMKMRYHDMSEC